MNKKVKVSLVGLATVVLLLSVGMYFFVLNNEDKVDNGTSDIRKITRDSQLEEPLNSSVDRTVSVKENKYYTIYMKKDNGTGSSFVPLKLNPDFKNDSDYQLSISFDDNGNIINGDKIIVIDNFLISKDNKEMIKKIAGENYDEALKEIEERVIETKNNLEKEGL